MELLAILEVCDLTERRAPPVMLTPRSSATATALIGIPLSLSLSLTNLARGRDEATILDLSASVKPSSSATSANLVPASIAAAAAATLLSWIVSCVASSTCRNSKVAWCLDRALTLPARRAM